MLGSLAKAEKPAEPTKPADQAQTVSEKLTIPEQDSPDSNSGLKISVEPLIKTPKKKDQSDTPRDEPSKTTAKTASETPQTIQPVNEPVKESVDEGPVIPASVLPTQPESSPQAVEELKSTEPKTDSTTPSNPTPAVEEPNIPASVLPTQVDKETEKDSKEDTTDKDAAEKDSGEKHSAEKDAAKKDSSKKDDSKSSEKKSGMERRRAKTESMLPTLSDESVDELPDSFTPVPLIDTDELPSMGELNIETEVNIGIKAEVIDRKAEQQAIKRKGKMRMIRSFFWVTLGLALLVIVGFFLLKIDFLIDLSK